MKSKPIVFTLFLFNVLYTISKAQVVSILPVFATQNDQVTITFDASQGNKGLYNLNADVYAHTGVITSKSTSSSDWKYVQGVWGQATAKTKMTSLGNNLYSISFDIRTFYGIPSGEDVLKLAFVFRNADGSKKGANSDNSDIFIPLSNSSFGVQFTSPKKETLLQPDSSIFIQAIAPKKCNLYVYFNDSLLASANDSVIQVTTQFGDLKTSKPNFYVKAIYQGNVYMDTTYCIRAFSPNVAVAPAGTKDGINYESDSTVVLQLYAPGKSYVYVVGDFTNWQTDPAYLMNKIPSGSRFWIRLKGLNPTQEYRFQYQIGSDKLRVAEPYSEKILDPNYDGSIGSVYPNLIAYPTGKTNDIVTVFKPRRDVYNWAYTSNFTKPSIDQLLIYELLVRDFVGTHSYLTLCDTIAYLKKLGINAVELMPVMEFDGNDSWGYNPNFHMALDKYYGTPDQLKRFIDLCHQNGIAVILDVVLNHAWGLHPFVKMYYDASTGKTTSDNPWFNVDATHPYNVGFDFNHESSATQYYVDQVLAYWVNEFKIDGYRFDLAKGFTQTNHPNDVNAWSSYDASRINNWRRIKNEFRKTCADCYMILENFADNTEETVLANEGFLTWTNLNNAFCQNAMGFNSSNDLGWSDYKVRGFAQPMSVVYGESHDEERIMYKNITYGNSNGTYSAKNLSTALLRTEAALPIFTLLKGPKMFWQFEELGYDISINQNGRLGAKPILWNYLNVPERKRLHDVCALINALKKEPELASTDYSFSGSGEVKTLQIRSTTLNVQVVSNFSMNTQAIQFQLPHAGKWFSYLQGDSVILDSTKLNIQLSAGSYMLWTDRNFNHKPIEYSAINNINYLNKNLQIYPNPTHQIIQISFSENLPNESELVIFSADGKDVYHSMINDLYIGRNNSIQMDLSNLNLTNGLYFIQVKNKLGNYKPQSFIYTNE